MLVDHTDAPTDSVGGRGNRYRFAIQEDLSFVRTIHTIKYLHQGAFASTVFAQQSMNFARLYVEVDAIVGQHTREPLADAAHFQGVDP